MQTQQHPTVTVTKLAATTDVADKMERTVSQWLAAGTPLLWVPIIDVDGGPAGLAAAQEASQEFDGGWLIHDTTDLLTLPEGIKGWLLPIEATDSDVVCGRWGQEITFMQVNDRRTGAVVTYQTDTDGERARQ